MAKQRRPAKRSVKQTDTRSTKPPDAKAARQAKATKRMAREARQQAKSAARSARKIERRLARLVDDQRGLRKRVKRLAVRLDQELTRPLPVSPPVMVPPGAGGGGWRRGRPDGGPPWARGLGPVASVEVPLENDDPGAPLWATVAARLPEEITTVGDDGRVIRYRYSAVGSTPQAPRYRRLADGDTPPPPPTARQ